MSNSTESHTMGSAETSTPSELSAPDMFYVTIEALALSCKDAEVETVSLLHKFAQEHPVEYTPPTTPEDQVTSAANRIDLAIGNFLQDATPCAGFSLLDAQSVSQLCEYYNRTNLLALACEFFDTARTTTADMDVSILFRYRTVLSQLEQRARELRIAEETESTELSRPERIGHRTWAGNFHPYAFETGVVLDTELNAMSHHDDAYQETIIIDGAIVTVHRLRRTE